MFRTKWIVFLSAALLCAGTADAVRVQRLSLSEVRDQASSIIVAVVTDQDTRLGPEGKMVWTDYELDVVEVLRGDEFQTSIRLSFAGGEADGRQVGITGVPQLEEEAQYVLFLLPSEIPWATPTIGWGQGIFEVVPRRSKREVEVLLSYDSEPLEISEDGLRRGALVRRTDGWIEGYDALPSFGSEPEDEPVVLSADGKPIPQAPRAPEPEALSLDQRSFATLDDLRNFVQGEIQEDAGGQ